MLDRINALITSDVTDIYIGGAGIWVQRDGGATRADIHLTESQVRELAIKLVNLGGRHIDDASPCVDVRLAEGVRVHAVLSPVSIGGTEISIRVPRPDFQRLHDWVSAGDISPAMAERLRDVVKQRQTVLVSGATGAGKTALLASLMSEVESHQRIITIEDVAELKIQHPRCVGLEVRQPNTDGRGEISIADLVRHSLRMRPERLIVGECRGAEVVDMLRAFTTGHSGGGTTLHANTLSEVAVRIDSLGALAGMSSPAIARLASSAIDVIIHIQNDAGRRRMSLGRFVVENGILCVVRDSEPALRDATHVA